jgi:hypothetical protein
MDCDEGVAAPSGRIYQARKESGSSVPRPRATTLSRLLGATFGQAPAIALAREMPSIETDGIDFAIQTGKLGA